MGKILRSPDAWILLLAVVALIPLAFLRGAGVLDPLLFLCALILFLVPGMLLAYWFVGAWASGPAVIPVGFAISTGIFGLLAVPILILNLSMSTYLLLSGAVVGTSLVAVVIRVFVGGSPEPEKNGAQDYGSAGGPLWILFSLLAAGLAFVSRTKVPSLQDDMWIYLAYVRDFVGSEELARYEPYFGNETGLSRLKVNGWLLEQAALARVSGVDAVETALWYLNPALVVVSLLAFYVLARTLFKNEVAALVAACLYALYFAVQLDDSILTEGGEFAARLVEDKYAARFIFLPLALAAAVRFLENSKLRYLVVFAFLCWSVVTVHPVGIAVIGVAMIGFAIVYLAMNLRNWRAWARIVGLGAAGASVTLLPLLLSVATRIPLPDLLRAADINSGDPRVLANMVFVKPWRQRILEFDDGSYIMHPVLLADPVVLVALLAGIPFLIWRLRGSPAAQLLLGALVFVTVIDYVPPIATFVGDNLVLPWQLHRLAWAISLAASLTVAWMAWELLRYAQRSLNDPGGAGRVSRFLPAIVVAVLMVAAAPAAVAGANDLALGNRIQPSGAALGFDPLFRWMRDNINEPSVVMAPGPENTVVAGWSDQANVVSLRAALVFEVLPLLEERAGEKIEMPQGAIDRRSFYNEAGPEEQLDILRRHDVNYVMVHKGSPQEEQVRNLPGLTPVPGAPQEMYVLYSVDLQQTQA